MNTLNQKDINMPKRDEAIGLRLKLGSQRIGIDLSV